MRKGWAETTLGEIAEVNMGQSPPGDTYNTEGIGMPFMQGSAEFGEHYPEPVKFCSAPAKIAEIGDLLLSVRAPVGDSNFANQRIAIGRGLATVRARTGADTHFLRLVIQLNTAGLLATSGTGMFSSITGKNLREFGVNLPPLLEQKRIVDVVSSVDAYIDALQKQADTARAARNAVLHELLSAGGDDWTISTIGGISKFISKRESPKALARDTPYVGLEHVEPKTTLISAWGNVQSVSSSVTPFEPEDTLFGRLRPYLHKVAFADFPGVCSPEILVLRSNAKCESKFLYLLCSLDSTIKNCVDMSAGTRMPRTSTTDLASIEIQLPPISEQKRIVEIVSSMDEMILSTELAVFNAKTLRSGLLSDLLSGNHEISASYDSLLGAT